MPRTSAATKEKVVSKAVSVDEGPTIVNLYDGKVTIKAYLKGERHSYWKDGKRIKSVTGAYAILDKSRALMPWAVEMSMKYLGQFVGQPLTMDMLWDAEGQHEAVKAEAANVGKAAHSWIEQYVKGMKPEMPEDPNVAQAVSGFLSWVKEKSVKFMDAEKLVYSKKHNYVGMMDATATLGGMRGKFVIDYKVSNGLYSQVAYQTAAYQKADEEESGVEYGGRWAIRLSKETKAEYEARMEEKMKKYLRKNPDKEPYEIAPYQPFEARFLSPQTVERDFKVHLLCMELSTAHGEVDAEFFPGKWKK